MRFLPNGRVFGVGGRNDISLGQTLPLYTARHDIMLTHNIFVNFHERNLRAYINFNCEIILFMLK